MWFVIYENKWINERTNKWMNEEINEWEFSARFLQRTICQRQS